MTTQQESLLWTLEEISHLVSHSGQPEETLGNIVQLIRRTFDTDVCSVYLLEPDRATLAGVMIESLDPAPAPEVKAAWSREIERRVREIDDGTVELIDWEEIRDELFAE